MVNTPEKLLRPNSPFESSDPWYQQPDGKGFVRTGEFQQVEFMIKDSIKYASTMGWGWGRWRGADLKPYGTTRAFSDECIGCHTPVRRNDYVFTMPIKGL